jgi:acetolactate synthase-1/3 small subunit
VDILLKKLKEIIFMKDRQILTIIAENEAGVLARVTDAFTSRGYSIENINAGLVNYGNNTSSITIVLYETVERINRIIPQIKKIVPIVDIKNITDNNISKELVLANYEYENRGIKKIIQKYSPTKIYTDDKKNVLELVAISEIVDDFVKDLNSIGCYNIVRSGILAIKL